MKKVSKKILAWQARNIQEIAESFPEKSLEISRKSGKFLIGRKYFVVWELLYFMEISSISKQSIKQTFWYQVSLKSPKF